MVWKETFLSEIDICEDKHQFAYLLLVSELDGFSHRTNMFTSTPGCFSKTTITTT